MSNFLFLLLHEAEILMYKTVFHFFLNTYIPGQKLSSCPTFFAALSPFPASL